MTSPSAPLPKAVNKVLDPSAGLISYRVSLTVAPSPVTPNNRPEDEKVMDEKLSPKLPICVIVASVGLNVQSIRPLTPLTLTIAYIMPVTGFLAAPLTPVTVKPGRTGARLSIMA